MKRITSHLLAILLLVSCDFTPSTQIKTGAAEEKDDTKILQEFFEAYETKLYHAANAIKEKEVMAQRDTAFMAMMDTLGVFNNLRGEMDLLNIRDFRFRGQNYQELSFQVCFTDSHDIICANFSYEKLFKKGTIEKDYIYNQVKEIPLKSKVYFDGVIATNAETNLPKHRDEYTKYHPRFAFYFMNISTAPNDTISPALRKAAAAARASNTYAARKIRHEMFSEKTFKALSDTAKLYKSNLSEKEQEYMTRYIQAIFGDISGNN